MTKKKKKKKKPDSKSYNRRQSSRRYEKYTVNHEDDTPSISIKAFSISIVRDFAGYAFGYIQRH